MKRKAAAVLLAVLATATAVAAQPRKFIDSLRLQRMAVSYQNDRTVVLDSGGIACSDCVPPTFTDLSAALAYVSAQTGRSQFSRWHVVVFPGDTSSSGLGQYDFSTVTVPSFTTVEGVVGAWQNGTAVVGPPVLHPTATSGDLITLGQSSQLVNLLVHVSAVSAATNVVNAVCLSGNPCGGTNLAIYVSAGTDQDLDLVRLTSGSWLSHGLNLARSTANTKTRGLAAVTGAVTLYGGRIQLGSGSPAAVENLGSSAMTLQGVRIDAGPTVDLKRSSSGTIVAKGVYFASESGTIDAGTLPVDGLEIDNNVTLTAPATDILKVGKVLRKVVSVSAPYACDAAALGDEYIDSTTPSPCWCNGSVWTAFVALGDCT